MMTEDTLPYFVMGYSDFLDRFYLLSNKSFDTYEDALNWSLNCADELKAFVVQPVGENV